MMVWLPFLASCAGVLMLFIMPQWAEPQRHTVAVVCVSVYVFCAHFSVTAKKTSAKNCNASVMRPGADLEKKVGWAVCKALFKIMNINESLMHLWQSSLLTYVSVTHAHTGNSRTC